MPGKTIVITGGSDGIGAAAARQLTQQGERVVLVGRSPQKTEAVAREIGANWYLADFAELDDVRELAEKLLAAYPRIDVLANNAGGLMGDRTVTVDGHELTFQVNHLAPFLLTSLLHDRLVESQATVIGTASSAGRVFGRVDLDDLESAHDYRPSRAYGTTKLQNIMFARELDRRYRDSGISAASFHPGIVATNFSSGSNSHLRRFYARGVRRFLTTAEKGADTLVWLATTRPGVDWPHGEYFTHRTVSKSNRQAYDETLCRGLWDRSAALVGVG
ncbi:SDR family NAD(P)-dependent oxidoreductase [Lacisediminihabitans changchengi]|uniref:SDR family NAD(P)-dependent oxidoreductase n=1 Tax=Lacisediminihabitans changchengi TaxID=2787634 RepID=A0A934SGR6_9MICO|nr:SDR family NAD(P)-dependent oxidoreductase [Lacisediminihabitans changchengi]MBK4346326.1 SDR family NAD(P)-dependent oxidoreductase [Lacisediminihabitans changchengi]